MHLLCHLLFAHPVVSTHEERGADVAAASPDRLLPDFKAHAAQTTALTLRALNGRITVTPTSGSNLRATWQVS